VVHVLGFRTVGKIDLLLLVNGSFCWVFSPDKNLISMLDLKKRTIRVYFNSSLLSFNSHRDLVGYMSRFDSCRVVLYSLLLIY